VKRQKMAMMPGICGVVYKRKKHHTGEEFQKLKSIYKRDIAGNSKIAARGRKQKVCLLK
jgi:hypothetical protein